ncbi:PCC domain-containing protein [Amaricoccus solimangrovi]|uniref:DNA-binding protein n=1 Tax=Amaricoccus solimangrovi TaxID=2589815 RepID=A0A501WCI9_9RHOB|nr:PPC domain-containing DNA-binding protein [Amaricoccus solimangrovi]TPE47108.1 DNA-binding protein [Amaricoccus solimangrovi]
MSYSVKGKLAELIYVRLDKGEDLLQAIKDAAVEHDIKTGAVLDITGSVTKARVQKFPGKTNDAAVRIEVVEIDGPLEMTGHGIIGMTEGSGGIGEYKDGEPYVHVHVVVTSADYTICGHLMPGTFIRSHLEKSHFTIILAKTEGVSLTAAFEQTPDGKGRIYHDLKSA